MNIETKFQLYSNDSCLLVTKTYLLTTKHKNGFSRLEALYVFLICAKNLLINSCLCSFSIKIFTCATHVLAVDASSQHVHQQIASNSQYTLPPRSSLQKTTQGKSKLRSKEAQSDHSQRISYIWVAVSNSTLLAFRRQTGWRRKKMNNSEFQQFQVGHLKTVSTHYYCCCRLGQPI